MWRVKTLLRPWLALKLGLGVLATAYDARSSPIELSLSGPAECPDAAAIRDQVQKLARVAADDPRHLEARVVIDTTQAGRVRLVLTARIDDGAAGERSFVGASCVEVTDAAALVLALMLNPDAAPANDQTEPSTLPPSLAPTTAPSAAARKRPVSRQPSVHAHAGLSVGARVGIMPAVNPEIGGTIGVSVDDFYGWLGVAVTSSQTAHVPGTPYGGRFWALNGTGLACWAPVGDDRIGFGPCVGLGFTRIAGRGVSVTHASDSQVSWISGTLGLSGAVAAGSRVSFRGLLLGALPTTRSTFYLQDIGAVHRPAPASASFQGILAVRLF